MHFIVVNRFLENTTLISIKIDRKRNRTRFFLIWYFHTSSMSFTVLIVTFFCFSQIQLEMWIKSRKCAIARICWCLQNHQTSLSYKNRVKRKNENFTKSNSFELLRNVYIDFVCWLFFMMEFSSIFKNTWTEYFSVFFRLEQQQSEKSKKFFFLSLDCSIDTFNNDDANDDVVHAHKTQKQQSISWMLFSLENGNLFTGCAVSMEIEGSLASYRCVVFK